jgi:peptidoglycan LD-endopeptidase CwlK
MYKLSEASVRTMTGVHPDLIKVVRRAIEITEVDFKVGEGLRSKQRQRQLVNEGKSKTMNSRHLTGHAVDLWALVDGKISWQQAPYIKIAEAMKTAAKELGIKIRWGGDWDGDGNWKEEKFFDGPHFELSSAVYPA